MQLQPLLLPSPSHLPFALLLLFVLKLRLRLVTELNRTENFLFFLPFSWCTLSGRGKKEKYSMPLCVPLWPCWRAGVGFSVKSPYYRAEESKQPIARAALPPHLRPIRGSQSAFSGLAAVRKGRGGGEKKIPPGQNCARVCMCACVRMCKQL